MADDPIWEIRLAVPNPDFQPGPHRLSDMRQMIIEGRLTENDFARAMGSDWQPLRSFPAIDKLFTEKIQIEREVHGDEEHCAEHRDQSPGWRCTRCQNYLCKECVVNRPVIAGGAANYLCGHCEAYTTPVKSKGSLKKGLGFFKRQ